jgi:hypothetical protein
MGRMRLIDLLSHPENLDEKTLDSLKEALDAYPFFQAGRMLWIKNLHKVDHIRYNNELKLAAAFIPDRSKLFFLINDVFSSLSGPDRNGEEDETKNEDCLSEEVVIPESDLNSTVEDNDSEANLIERKEKSEDKDSSPEIPDQMVGADANYFEVDDSFVSASGEIIDFSISRQDVIENEETDSEEADGKEAGEEDTALPAAELFDYERKASYSGYSIEDEVPEASPDLDESHTFSEWLNLLKNQQVTFSGNEEEKTEKAPKKPGRMDLIDNFLNNKGTQKRIVPSSEGNSTNEDFSIRSLQENEDLMTETLANIHIKQKRYQKAVVIFERLRLKYPEKSVYFARRIQEMEDLISNQ